MGPHSWVPPVVGHYLSVPMGHWLALLVGSDGRGDVMKDKGRVNVFDTEQACVHAGVQEDGWHTCTPFN